MTKNIMKQQEKYREQLQNRTINPSSDSWEKLSKRLNTYDAVEKKSRKWIILKYVASILLIISAGFFFYQPNEKVIDTPIIVAPTIKEEIKKLPEENSNPKIEVVTNSNSTTKKEVKKQLQLPKNFGVENETTQEDLAVNDTIEIFINETIINETIETSLIAKEENNIDIEVEQLLKNATKNQILTTEKVISAQDLLLEVEEDLDKDFKEKLIDNIVNTLKKPRIVISDRGN